MSGEDTFFMLFGMLIVFGPWAVVIVGVLFTNAREREYMAEQRITGRDKRQMIDFMQIVMKEYYGEYTYVAGGYRISTGRFSANYYPYIVGFLQAVQALGRITGLDMVAAEKIIRCWDRYWY